ncbi:hypothetical protein GPALN_012425 [Globodera pallida]|nr:hypothetical protein GPALN_012425 [Globodera pallida]
MLGNCGQRRRTGAVTVTAAASAEVAAVPSILSLLVQLLLITALIANVGCAGKAAAAVITARQILSQQPPIGRPRRHDDQRAAFDLVRLEQQLALAVRAHHLLADSRQSLKDEPNPNRHRVIEEDDDGTAGAVEEQPPPVDSCRQQCDEQLRMGLDMVKAHSAFGSIGVPSVLDVLDLQLFCRVDTDHDTCLLGLKFLQFNMRDFVCKRKRKELISHLGCYAHAAPQLRRQCGTARCGPYRELELSLIGVSQRCRTLLCDLECTRTRLAQQSACRERGRPALQYLLTYSQIQVRDQNFLVVFLCASATSPFQLFPSKRFSGTRMAARPARRCERTSGRHLLARNAALLPTADLWTK